MTRPPAALCPATSTAILDPGRLDALARTALLDSAPEAEFDRLTALTARVAGAPVSLVNLVDADRTYVKSAHNFDPPPGRDIPPSHSLCQHVVGSGAPLVVDDAASHPLVRENGAVTELGVGAYLGVPVRTPSGQVVGSLCAIDFRPREWSAEDQTALETLAASVEGEIALRQRLEEGERAEALARSEAEALATVVGVNAQLAAELDPDRLVQDVIDAGTAITGAAFGAFFYSPGRGHGHALLFAVSGAPRAAFERLGAVRMTPVFEPSFSGRGSVRSDDITQDARYGRMGGMPEGHLPARSYLSVPVRDADRTPLGALLFGHPDVGAFEARDEQVAEAIAVQAAIALQNARLHRALNESERRHRTVLANLHDVVFQTDVEGRFTYLNDAWTGATGHAVADSLGRHCLAFSAGGADPLADLVRTIARSGPDGSAGSFQTPLEVRHADGTTRHVEAAWRPSYREDGSHDGWTGTLTDVTDTVRYHTEREAREAAEAARAEAERMAQLKTAFLANMSHEIRTPLTAVLGNAEILNEEVSATLRPLTGSVLSGGRRLLSTLNAVLDLAQIEAGQMTPTPRPVDVAEFVRAAARDLSPIADAKGLAFDVDAPDDLPEVAVDDGILDRALANLLGNAVKFTDRGGVSLRARYTDGRLELVVADTGIGIAPEALPYLFDEFRQASEGDARTHEGNGLGLALARKAVSILGGTIGVESRPGVGSRFTVSVPCETVTDVPVAA